VPFSCQGSGYWYFKCLCLELKAGAGPEYLPAPLGPGSMEWMPAWADLWAGPAFGTPLWIGDEDMICPAKGFSVAVNRSGFDVHPVARPLPHFTFKGKSPKFMRHHPPLDRSFETGLVLNRGARLGLFLRGSPIGGACCRRGLSLSHSPSHPMRDAALYWPRLAPTSGSRILAGGAGLPRVAPKRVSHGQQNAYRCVSPRRNQGGRPSW